MTTEQTYIERFARLVATAKFHGLDPSVETLVLLATQYSVLLPAANIRRMAQGLSPFEGA